MRQIMPFIAGWPAFAITPEIREHLMRISPSAIDRYLKKDKDALRMKGKSLTKPVMALKMRIPLRTFYSSEERKKPGFIQIDTVHHCGQAASGEYADLWSESNRKTAPLSRSMSAMTGSQAPRNKPSWQFVALRA
jgi:hypothetical protein